MGCRLVFVEFQGGRLFGSLDRLDFDDSRLGLPGLEIRIERPRLSVTLVGYFAENQRGFLILEFCCLDCRWIFGASISTLVFFGTISGGIGT